MTGTTLELIFSGLMILSMPEGERQQAVVVFPEDDKHLLIQILVQGRETCERINASGGNVQAADSPLFDLGGGVLEIDYRSGEPSLEWSEVIPAGVVPETNGEAASLFWLPRLSPMVIGTSRLRNPCGDRGADCPGSEARFFIDRGTISSCHLVHDPRDGDHVKVYDLPNAGTQALSDMVMVRHEVPENHVILNRGGHRCRLEPVDGKIVYLMVNAALNEDSHFSRLHQFHRHFYQRMDRSKPKNPRLEGMKMDLIGYCEQVIADAGQALEAQAAIHGSAGPATFHIHSSTECGTASQP